MKKRPTKEQEAELVAAIRVAFADDKAFDATSIFQRANRGDCPRLTQIVEAIIGPNARYKRGAVGGAGG
jgi:hypothetical protein